MADKLTMSKQEADDRHIDYKYWLDPGIVVGDWVETDDGYITKVKRIREYRNSAGHLSSYVTCGTGTFIKEFTQSFVIGDILANKIKPRGTGPYGTPKISVWDKMFVDMLFEGMSHAKAAHIAYKSLDGKHVSVSRVLRKPTVIRYMSTKYNEEMEKAGLTKDWYFKALKSEAENLDNKGSERFAALERIGRLLDVIQESRVTELSETRTAYLDEGAIDKLEQKQTLVLNE